MRAVTIDKDKLDGFVVYDAPMPPNRGVLDPITVYINDSEPGRGGLLVVCYGSAWSCFWGAMGKGSTVRQFLLGSDAGYVANCLIQARRQWISSRAAERRELAYLGNICEAIIAKVRADAAKDSKARDRALLDATPDDELGGND